MNKSILDSWMVWLPFSIISLFQAVQGMTFDNGIENIPFLIFAGRFYDLSLFVFGFAHALQIAFIPVLSRIGAIRYHAESARQRN